MGTHSGSSELHEWIRVIIKGLEGVVQIKDDIVIHGKGKEHDEQLREFLARLWKHGLTLRVKKCKFRVAEVLWFRHI